MNKQTITFEQFKKLITDNGKKANACIEQYKRILSSSNFEELLQVIKDNYDWCFNNSIFTKDDIKAIGEEVLLPNGFYYDYNGIIDSVKCAFVYDGVIQEVRGNATIQDVRGNATIQDVRGNATVQNVGDNATVQNVGDNATVQNVGDNGIYKDYRYNKPKLVMKKDAFEIVYID